MTDEQPAFLISIDEHNYSNGRVNQRELLNKAMAGL